jgi:hypothetical protein
MNSEDRRQLLIVKQSQMQRALEYYTLRGITPTTIELFTTVELFTDYVMNGITPEVKSRSNGMDKYLQTRNLLLDKVVE